MNEFEGPRSDSVDERDQWFVQAANGTIDKGTFQKSIVFRHDVRMIAAQVTVTVAIIVQRQAFATDRAFVSIEAKVAAGIEAPAFR